MKLNALVVDDSRIMRKMVMDALTKTELAEFEFTEAEDGVDALDKFDVQTTNIVFADWNMPKMTGIDFVHKVRGMKNTSHIPILMVTSEKTMGKMEIALDKAGANGYICKPFTADELKRHLVKIVRDIEKAQTAPPAKPASGGGFFSKIMQGIN